MTTWRMHALAEPMHLRRGTHVAKRTHARTSATRRQRQHVGAAASFPPRCSTHQVPARCSSSICVLPMHLRRGTWQNLHHLHRRTHALRRASCKSMHARTCATRRQRQPVISAAASLLVAACARSASLRAAHACLHGTCASRRRHLPVPLRGAPSSRTLTAWDAARVKVPVAPSHHL